MGGVLIAAGGTGGHVYPALAVAESLRDRGHHVEFVGGDRIESRLVPEAGFPLHRLPARGLPRSLDPAAAAAAVAMLRSLAGARRLLRRMRPDAVLGLGGYPSLAPSLVAGRSGVPVVLHEQNAVVSLSNRLSARWARVLATSLPLRGWAPSPGGPSVVLTGNPLRPAVRALAEAAPGGRRRDAAARLGLDPARPTLLAFGGSQGARPLNEALPGAVAALGEERVQVLHVAGPGHEEDVRARWAAGGGTAVVRPYVDAMEDAYASADLVVARSGASTVAELCAVGLPSVLVPLPFAAGDAQAANARALEEGGAAVRVDEGPDLPARLAEAIRALLDPGRREAAAAAARGLARPDATDRVADLVEAELR